MEQCYQHITIWAAKQESKRKIKVELSYGFNTNPLVKAETLLLIRAMNLGRKTVTLSSVGLILPRKDRNYVTFLNPVGNVNFLMI